jgi:TPR repeat/Glycosyltransferase family 9 (heptosyltransferase)/Tetratricopeptide repeat
MSQPPTQQFPGLPPFTPRAGMTIQDVIDEAVAMHRSGKLAEAEVRYRAILDIHPNNVDALHLLGLLAHSVGSNDLAQSLVSRACQLLPTSAAFHNTLGEIYRVRGRLDMAYHCYQKALRYEPDMPEALNNMGILYAFQCQTDKSIETFRQAIRIRPDYAEAHDGLGLTLLLAGQLQEGWTEQEWRWKKSILAHTRRNFSEPMWDGKPLGKKTLLIYSEQGFGDVLQFCRYVPLAKNFLGPDTTVIFEVPPELETLMRTVGGYDSLIVRSPSMPHFDLQIPLMSVPWVMGTTLETIPAAVPYLKADEAKVARWRKRIDDLGPGKKVGIAWAGRPTHPRDAARSITLQQMAPLGANGNAEGVIFVSVQKGPAQEQLKNPPLGMKIVDVANELMDFDDTAALVSVLDLVVAVDTSINHLCGALNRPAWVLSPFSPDWRWLLGREDSPWYPSLRVFRQPAHEAWAPLLDVVAQRFGDWARQ